MNYACQRCPDWVPPKGFCPEPPEPPPPICKIATTGAQAAPALASPWGTVWATNNWAWASWRFWSYWLAVSPSTTFEFAFPVYTYDEYTYDVPDAVDDARCYFPLASGEDASSFFYCSYLTPPECVKCTYEFWFGFNFYCNNG